MPASAIGLVVVKPAKRGSTSSMTAVEHATSLGELGLEVFAGEDPGRTQPQRAPSSAASA